MIRFIRNLFKVASGFLTIVVFTVVILGVILLVTTNNYRIFESVHYYLFLFLLIDTCIRVLIKPSKTIDYFKNISWLFKYFASIANVRNC